MTRRGAALAAAAAAARTTPHTVDAAPHTRPPKKQKKQSVVYKAFRKADGRAYALKEVRLAGLSDGELQAVVGEARVLGALGDCPHVLRYLDAFFNAGKLYIVTGMRTMVMMKEEGGCCKRILPSARTHKLSYTHARHTEFASGGSLQDALERGGGGAAPIMPEAAWWRVCLGALLGLHHMHRRGVIFALLLPLMELCARAHTPAHTQPHPPLNKQTIQQKGAAPRRQGRQHLPRRHRRRQARRPRHGQGFFLLLCV